MTTAVTLHARSTPPDGGWPPARVRFRQPVSSTGFIDGAWWPRSRDLTAELPALLEVLWTANREITRVSYHAAAWEPTPRRLTVDDRVMRLGAFTAGDPSTVGLVDSWGYERIDLLVIAPDTDPEVAQRTLTLASTAGNPYRAGETLARSANSPIDGAATE